MSLQSPPLAVNKGKLSRLLSAAVVNQDFCRLLLSDPERAVINGYRGESFDLSSAECLFLSSIDATSLADFADQILNHSDQNGHNGHKNGA